LNALAPSCGASVTTPVRPRSKIWRCLIATMVFAGWSGAIFGCEIVAENAIVRAATPSAKGAALYLSLKNTCLADDKLTGASSDSAKRAVLHTHDPRSDGVAAMRMAENGFELPAGEVIELAPGGDHIMLMGFANGLHQIDALDIELQFKNSDMMLLKVPVAFAAR